MIVFQFLVRSTTLNREADVPAVTMVWDIVPESRSISFQVPGRLGRDAALICEAENAVNKPVPLSAGTMECSRVELSCS